MAPRLPLVRVSGRNRQMPSGDVVPVSAGGTGAVSSAAARANLSALNASLPSMRNRLINGAMTINQRAFAGGSLATGAYGYDRWKAGSSAASISVNNAGVITHTSGPVVQVIEEVNASYLSGKQVTISVEDPTGSLSVSLAFSATDTTSVTASISAGSGRQSAVLNLPSGSGNLTVTLTASGITYSRVQLELGGIATSWDERPYTIEQLLCLRYYFPIRVSVRGYAAAASTNFDSSVVFPVPMRSTPSATLTAGSRGNTSSVNIYPLSNQAARHEATSTSTGDTYALSDLAVFTSEL